MFFSLYADSNKDKKGTFYFFYSYNTELIDDRFVWAFYEATSLVLFLFIFTYPLWIAEFVHNLFYDKVQYNRKLSISSESLHLIALIFTFFLKFAGIRFIRCLSVFLTFLQRWSKLLLFAHFMFF